MKKDLCRRTKASRELSDSLVRKNEPERTEVYWRNQSLGQRGDPGEVEAELVIPRPNNADMLLRFMGKLEQTLHYNYASIKRMVPSWDWSTVITILLWSPTLTNLLDKIGNMPDVEMVEEEPLGDGALSGFPRKFRLLPRSNISVSKRIRVTLKETDVARQEPELIPVLA